MTDLQVSLEPAAGLERRLRIQVPALHIEQEVESRLRDAGRTANLKGYRPGRVPAQVIRQRFGARIRDEVLQDVVQRSYSEAITRENLRPAGNPRIEADPPAAGQDFAYTAVVEVYPEFTVVGLDTLDVEKPEVTVTEEDIDRTVERLRRQAGTWIDVERPAASGDKVSVSFAGRIGDQPIEGGSADEAEIVLGEGRMIPGFESAIEGVAPGASKTFGLRFPDDYFEEKLRGQDAVFDLRLSQVFERQLPEVNAEFIAGFNVSPAEVGEFRQLIRTNLEREAASRAQADMRRQVMEHLLANNGVELPRGLVSREAAGLQAEGMRNMGIQRPEQAPPVEAYREIAERRVRLGLIIGAVIREQGLKLDQQRVDIRLDELCRSYDRPSEARRLYIENPGMMAQIENSVLEEQAMNWLIERARVRPRVTAFADLVAG